MPTPGVARGAASVERAWRPAEPWPARLDIQPWSPFRPSGHRLCRALRASRVGALRAPV